MSSTTITTHGVTKIEAEFRKATRSNDFMRLTIIDRKGDEFEIELYSHTGVHTFEALASAINAAQVTVDQVEGAE